MAALEAARESKNPLSCPCVASTSAGSSNAAAPFRATNGGQAGDSGRWAWGWGLGLGLGLGLARGALGCGACLAFGSSAHDYPPLGFAQSTPGSLSFVAQDRSSGVLGNCSSGVLATV